MRIQEIIESATCAKMTEESSMNGDLTSGVKREFGLENTANGPSSPSIFSSGDSECSSSGRLKFYKDGKFILELSHRMDGDRTCWMPVQRKTYWPAVGTPRQEGSTTLSVSDDNSSVQSSPWQRDHCWKQTSPRRGLGSEMELMMIRPGRLRRLLSSRAIHAKRRRPYDTRHIDVSVLKERGVGEKRPRLRPRLGTIVQGLLEKGSPGARLDSSIVSPRKRILRKLERVSLEDQAKRQRARQQRGGHQNSVSQSSRSVSSHTITSILSRGEDETSFLRTLLREPSPALSPSPPTTSPPSRRLPPFLAPTPLHPLYPPPPPPYYSPVPSYRGSPSLWTVHYPLSSLPRATTAPLGFSHVGGLYHPPSPLTAPWASPHHHHPFNQIKREDSVSDVPLNLSKHAG